MAEQAARREPVEPDPTPEPTRETGRETSRPTGQARAGTVAVHLVGLSRDRQRLMLTDDNGTEFALPVTPDLLEALSLGGRTTDPAGTAGPAQQESHRVETKMTSSIRPREIQTRIRAGETAETVAAAAGTTVEAIMAYVGPVLAEREHVAERAQRASVRRAPGENPTPGTARALGDAVAAHLRSRGADPAAVAWDAYRRETGRWVLTATYDAERSGTAHFTYDAPGNYVMLDDDDARWLVGDTLAEPVAPARDDLRQVRERRLSAAPEELPLGVEAPVEPAPAPVADQRRDVDLELPLGGEAPAPAPQREQPAPPAPAAEEPAAEEAPQRRPVQKKRGRASVPSWDEIMFGGSGD